MDDRGRLIRFGVFYAVIFGVIAIVIPFMPIYLKLRGFSPSRIGLLLGAMEISGIAAPFLVSVVADRFGRYRGLMALLVVMSLISLAVLDRTVAFPLVMAASIAYGLSMKPFIPMSDALTGRSLSDSSGNYGKVRVWGTVSFIIVSLALQITSLMDTRDSGRLFSVIFTAFVFLMAAVAIVPGVRRAGLDKTGAKDAVARNGKTDPEAAEAAMTEAGDAPAAAIGAAGVARGGNSGFAAAESSVRRQRSSGASIPGEFWIFLLIVSLGNFGFAAYQAFGSLYFSEIVGVAHVSGLFALAAVGEIPVMFFGGRILRRLGHVRMLAVAMATGILRMSVLALFPSPLPVVLSQLTHAFMYGFFLIAGVDVVNRMVPDGRRALGMGLFMAFSINAPQLLVSSIGGFLVENAGFSALFAAVAAFPLAALVLLAKFGSALHLDDRRRFR